MSLNASGVRDTARVLRISTDTVLSELRKKEAALESVNTTFLRTHNPDDMAVAIERAGEAEAEMDEMWSFVGHKGNPRWLWHAIDHHTGKVLAYVLAAAKTTSSCSSKRCWSLSGSRFLYGSLGGVQRHLTPTCIVRANGTPRKSSASI